MPQRHFHTAGLAVHVTSGVTPHHYYSKERVSLSNTLDLFTARPLSSLVLALLLVLLGVVAVSGLVPASDSRRYFAGHKWLLATVCWPWQHSSRSAQSRAGAFPCAKPGNEICRRAFVKHCLLHPHQFIQAEAAQRLGYI